MGNGKTNAAISGAASGAVAGPWGAVIGGAAGYLMGSDDNSQSYYDQMLKEAQNIPLPILKEYYPEVYKVVASINPELETSVNLGSSKLEAISQDPRLKQAQMSALTKLMDISENNGEDAQFKSQINKLQNTVNSNLKGNSDAITQNMATRGMSGGMSELVSKQLAAQNASNQQSQMGLDIQAQAQQRALQALMNQSSMANQMDQTGFNQQATVANAQDAISKFNAQNQQNVLSRNTATKNNSQQWNAQNQQNVSNQNVGASNQAQLYNLGLAQQQYDNELKKKGLVNQGYQSMANSASQQAQQQNQLVGNISSAVAQYAAANKTNNTTSSNTNKMDKIPKYNPETGRYE